MMKSLQLRLGAGAACLSIVLGTAASAPVRASIITPSVALDPKVERDLARLGEDDLYGVFVHFDGGSPADQLDLLRGHGLRPTSKFPSVDVVFAVGQVAAVRAVLQEPQVSYLEANRRLTYYGDTGPWATRARVAQEPVSGGPFRDSEGRILDGAGVGIAVVDTGVDGTHPDLAKRVAKNFKVVCSTPGLQNTSTGKCYGPYRFEQMGSTDTTGGHGTHVAGIVAGDGTASAGTYKGVAPGATLYGFGVGEVILVLSAAEAFQYILDNYDSFVPAIRVINNSYGDTGGTAHNPNSVFSKLTNALVERGVTMVFAAGNDGGDGTRDRTSSFSKNPTPGVISAANYNDWNSGHRDASLSTSSSRGLRGAPATYPDVSAPGSAIVSTCNPTLTTCDTGPTFGWQPYYASLGGTSMASPHVAAVAAMLYQAEPSLTPGEVEDVLQDNARRFAAGGAYESDPQNVGGLVSFDKGAGLLDVPTTLRSLGAPADDEPTPASDHVVASGDVGDVSGPGAADIDSLSVSEEATGLRYTLKVRDISDVGPFGMSVRLNQNVDGREFATSLVIDASGKVSIPSGGTRNNAPATEWAIDPVAETLSFFVPFAYLEDPSANAPVHNVRFSTFVQVVVDVIPGGLGVEAATKPRYGESFTIRPATAPTASPTPTATSTPTNSPTPTTSPSPTSSPSVAPTEPGLIAEDSTLRFTATSARAGQYSDDVTIAARLSDSAGEPIEGATVAFELMGRQDSRTFTAVTDAAGLATETLALAERAGPYQLNARYAGELGRYHGSADATGFVVEEEDSVTSLTVEGKSTSRRVSAKLTDKDTPANTIVGRSVDFFVEGEPVGSAVTNEQGVATLELSGRYGGTLMYKAEFLGDAYYAYSVERREV